MIKKIANNEIGIPISIVLSSVSIFSHLIFLFGFNLLNLLIIIIVTTIILIYETIYNRLIALEIKSRNKVLSDVIRDGEKHPKGWKAVFGKDNERLYRDFYVFNPEIGIYVIKEYNKNPYEIKGIGGKIARNVDEEIDREISQHAGDFGIIQGDFQKVLKNLERGIHPQKIFDAAIKGKKDLGISMPIRGQASNSKEKFRDLHNTLSTRRKKIDSKLEKMASDDGIYASYR